MCLRDIDLTLAQEKLDKLKMVGRGFEILEARMTSVLPVVEEMRELLSSVDGEKEVDKTRLWEVLGLEDGQMEMKIGVRPLLGVGPLRWVGGPAGLEADRLVMVI